MAIAVSSSFVDEVKEAVMGQVEADERVEALHLGLRQILLPLDFELLRPPPCLLLQARQHEDGTPRLTLRGHAGCDPRVGDGVARGSGPGGDGAPVLAIRRGRGGVAAVDGDARSGHSHRRCLRARLEQSWAGSFAARMRMRTSPQPAAMEEGAVASAPFLGNDDPSGAPPRVPVICLQDCRRRVNIRRRFIGLPSFATKDSSWGSAALRWVPVPPADVCSTSCWINHLVRWGPAPDLWACTLQAGSRAWPVRYQCCSLPSFGSQAVDGHKKSREQRGLKQGRQKLQPQVVQTLATTTRQLLLWCWKDESAIIWVSGLSFLYIWQRHQNHTSVVRLLLHRWLLRPNINRRSARSIHPGARVFDASAYTPHRHLCLSPRLSRRCCLLFRSLDLTVIRFPLGTSL